ncbi:hypothetical protein LVD13_01165 [Flavobacteriaceae bacterium D16]|nr:hypothetical protein [Flavobacteriaceae bacterium D16]
MSHNTKTKKETTSTQEFHTATKNWISSLEFIDDELRFIENLLCSYVFEPDTPNLFERLQDYKERLVDIQLRKKDLAKWLLDHENELSGLLESLQDKEDDSYSQGHRELQVEFLLFHEDFQQLKSEIFNYAGGILRKRRPEC